MQRTIQRVLKIGMYGLLAGFAFVASVVLGRQTGDDSASGVVSFTPEASADVYAQSSYSYSESGYYAESSYGEGGAEGGSTAGEGGGSAGEGGSSCCG